MSGTREDEQPHRRWPLALLAYLSIVIFGLTFQSFPPLLVYIQRDLALSYGDAGFLVGLFSLPGILVTIPIGLAADLYGPRKVGIAALITMVLGLATIAGGHSFLTIAFGRAVSGAGGLALSIIAAQLISRRFSGRALAKAMGLYNTGMPLGTIIAFVTFGSLASLYGWRVPIVLVAVGCAGLGLLFPLMYRMSGQPSEAVPSHAAELRLVQRLTHVSSLLRDAGGGIWLVGLSWLWFNFAAIAWLGFGPTYLISLGYPQTTAGTMAASLMWGALIISPLVGVIMDKSLSKHSLIIGGNLGMSAIFLLMPFASPSTLPVLMVGLAVAAALPPAPIFAYPGQIVSRDKLGLAFGIISTCLNVGAVAGPWAVGALRGALGNYHVGFALMALANILAALTIYLLKDGRTSR